MSQRDDSTSRICAGCGVTAPGMFPAGWTIKQDREPIGPQGLMMVVRERPYCLDCQHPELGASQDDIPSLDMIIIMLRVHADSLAVLGHDAAAVRLQLLIRDLKAGMA